MGRPPSLESLLGKKRKPEGEDSGLNEYREAQVSVGR